MLSFRAQPGSVPIVQTIRIKSTSQNLHYTASTQSGSWLAVGPQAGSTDGSSTITVAVNPANLSGGTTTGSITVTAPGAMEPLVIPVALAVSSQPDDISVGGQTNITVQLSGALGGPLQTMTYQLGSSISGETFSVVQSVAPWLTITPQTGSVPATLTLTADPNQAGLGSHMAQAYVAGGAGTDEVNFFVDFAVAEGSASTISASPSALTFAYTIGGTVPASQTVQLTSSTSNTFTATSDSSYVNVTPGQGTTSSTGTTLTISVTPNGLSAGSHTGNVTVSGGLSSGSSQIVIPVTINITSNAPTCTIPVTQVTFNSFLGQGAPPSQTVQLSCNVTTSFTAAPAQTTLDTVSPASGTITAGSSATLTISVLPGTLASGTYGDVITIAGTGVPTITLTVIYNISSATAIVASPMNLSFSQVAGGVAPPTQTVMLTSGTPTGFSVMSDVNFLTTNVSAGTTPATLTVTVNAIGLSAGTYQGHLNITGGAAAVQVTVTVNVTQSGTTATIIATPASLNFSFVSGGSLPNSQTTQLTTTPAETATSFNATSSVPWLDVDPTSGATDQLLTLTVNSNAKGLGTGTFPATVSITGGATTTTVTVMLTITNASSGAITATPSMLTFAAVAGGSAPGSQTVTLTSNPSTTFTAASTKPWLLVSPTSGTTNTNNLTVSVVPSGMGVGIYTGTITVTGGGGIVSISVTLNITASSSITAAPTSLSFVQILTGGLPAAQTVSLTAPTTTNFTVAFTQSWLSVSSTTGSTPATLTISANGAALAAGPYSDTITITGGATPVTIPVTLTVLAGSQDVITPSVLGVAFNQNLGDVAFQNQQVMLSSATQISFSASTNVSWLTVSPSTGTTPATLTLTENPSGMGLGSYTGTVTVVGGAAPVTIQVFLTIATAANAITATPSSVTFSQFVGGTAPGSQTVQLTSTNPTAFTAANTQSWLTVTPGSGTTNTSITLAVNPSSLVAGSYQDTVTITGGATTVTIPVTYTISPDTFVPAPATLSFAQTLGGAAPPSQTVQVTSGTQHTFNASVNQPWLSVSPMTGTSPVTLTVTANGASLAAGTYNGIITLNGAGSPVTITASLTVAVATGAVFSPTSLTFSVASGTQTSSTENLMVTSQAGQFSFTAAAAVSNGGSGTGNWLSVSPASSTTPSTLTVTANPAGLASGEYAGIITVTPTDGSIPTQNLSVTLNIASSGTTSNAFVRSVVSAASFQPGPVSPGELVTLFGLGLGPTTGVGATVLASGAIDTMAGGTQVLFDGVAAPILYAQAGQVNAIVPYNVYGRTTTNMQVSISGAFSAPIGLAVQNTAPGVFTVNGSGTGQASVINQDGTLNGPNFPAPSGSVIEIYGTGEGQTNPPGQDGRIISTDLRHPLAASSATIGNVPAMIQYIGSAPTLVSGVFQMNVVVPAGLTPGLQPLQLMIGGVTTQAGITVAVK